MSDAKLFDFEAELLHEREKAYMVENLKGEKVWLPKSLTERHADGSFTIPEWLAVEKELI